VFSFAFAPGGHLEKQTLCVFLFPEIVKIESMSRLFIRRPLQRPTGKEKKEYIDDEEGPLGVLLLEQGSEIVLEGKVTFKSQLPQLCFKALLKEGEQRSVTYMQCETCKLKCMATP